MRHRTTSKRKGRQSGFLEPLEIRMLLSGTVYHTGHYHTVLRNAALAAASGAVASSSLSTSSTSAASPSAGVASPGAGTATYDRNAAVNYANTYWGEVVGDGDYWVSGSTYNYYGAGQPVPNVTGDDCAHFVSSCIGSPPGGGGGGLTIPSRAGTYGEPGAARLDELLVGNSLGGYGTTYEYGQLVSSVSQLTPGDVLGYDWDGSGGGSMSGIDHTVVYVGNGEVDAHANSRHDVPWNYGNSGSTITFFIHITLPDTVAPNAPTNSSPANNATGVSTTPKLTASAFSDTVDGSSQTAAEWQIYKGSTLVYDSGTDTSDLASITVPSGKLSSGTAYTWKVRYEDNYGDWSSYSTATTFTVGTVVQDQPPTLTGVTASAATIGQGGTETLSPVGLGDTVGTITNVKYYLESNGTSGLQTGTGGDTLLATASSSPFTVNISTISQSPGNTYTIYAQATNDQGQTSPVQSTTYTVTQTVSSVTSQATTGSTITVTWPAMPTGVSNIDVERSYNGGGFVQVALLSGSATSYPDSSLQSDSPYTYRIRAVTGGSDGNYITAATIYTFIPGDANGDGVVNLLDYAILSANYGQTGMSWAQGDFNGDGSVDLVDFGLLSANFGKQLPILPV